MNEPSSSCEKRIMHELSARERDFANIWRRVQGDSDHAATFRALDPLGLEGEPVISVQFHRASAPAWLQMQLSETSPHGIEWVTYHCADLVGHAERLVTKSRTPALWLAATYYADLAAHLLEQARHREGS